MAETPAEETEQRVLILAPTAKDGQITRGLLKAEGVAGLVCRDLPAMTRELASGAAALVLTEESLGAPGIEGLLTALEDQPAWSDLPVVLMMRGAAGSPVATRVLRALRNVTLLERPAPMRSLVSAVLAAVRARQRQYQMREQIAALRRSEAAARALEEGERAARLESERAGRVKDEFLATLSHELRTPLNAILGWSQLLLRARDDRETLDEGLAVIERNTRVQVQLIDDLLDMSRIISGKMRLEVGPVDAASIVRAAVETVMPAARAKGIDLRTVVRPGLAPVAGDPNRLQQVVWNLLSNAIKFTPRGGQVEVSLGQVESHVEIDVSDTGQGIAPEFLPHVFERFRQADASTTRTYGGLGLGLAIVKHLVELHGGSVRVVSAGLGLGSTFTVLLPIAAVGAESSSAGASGADGCVTTDLSGTKVLVVDDEPDARGLVKRVLEECRAEVFTAGSAAEAVEIVASARPDVVVSDIGMPGMDGYEMLRRIRALGADRGGRVPAIALTAFARSEDRTRALLAGYLVHVAKPVEPQELIATVASVVGRTGARDGAD